MASAPVIGGAIPQPSIVKESVFMGVIWAGMIVSFLFLCFRFYTRIRRFGRFWMDDVFVLFGWLMVFTTTLLWHFTAHKMFMSTAVASGQVSFFDDPTFIEDTEYYLKRSIGIIILFYTSLACIKISFLLFFKRLLGGVYIKTLNFYWWTIFGITIATWIACCADIEFKCLASPLPEINAVCTQDWSINFQRATLIANCVMDVITDALIMTIPIAILWNVRISWKKKLALAGLFCLTIITISFSIIRVAVVSSASKLPDISWLYLWSSIEPPIAVIVSCLASFRTLFVKNEAPPPTTGGYFRSGEESFLKRMLNSGKKSASIAMSNLSGKAELPDRNYQDPENNCSRTTSGEQILHRETV
ncbi:hypothetical protein B0J14DRAFT_644878 [Halenospora varia]|nr:hypothetical protein B0J14DRAFT_644878 [Halenospora varia]